MKPIKNSRTPLIILFTFLALISSLTVYSKDRPNIVLIMTDDQGWGQTGYYNHPVLKTPHLDEMAKNGLRLDRFYAGAPNCSPTRASILTGRSNNRTGVTNHGYNIQLEEKTLPAALQKAGYMTGHFGKWHLNGQQGPGIPIVTEDPYGPRDYGFDTTISVSNYFDLNPFMARDGIAEKFTGDSSDVIVTEALKFIKSASSKKKPFFAVIWDGSPHSPFQASDQDTAPFKNLDQTSAKHYGELVAFDRSVGKLRQGLKDLRVRENTIVWYCSDNGGLNNVKPSSTGGLRGAKNTMYEGGLRVPAIIEWPAKISARVSTYPTCTMDIFPTLVDILNLPSSTMLNPIDGESIFKLFSKDIGKRDKPIPFQHLGRTVIIDNDFKIIEMNKKLELYNLSDDKAEENNLLNKHPEIAKELKKHLDEFKSSVSKSATGKDYPSGKISKPSGKIRWNESPLYKPYIEEWTSQGLMKGNNIKNKKANNNKIKGKKNKNK